MKRIHSVEFWIEPIEDVDPSYEGDKLYRWTLTINGEDMGGGDTNNLSTAAYDCSYFLECIDSRRYMPVALQGEDDPSEAEDEAILIDRMDAVRCSKMHHTHKGVRCVLQPGHDYGHAGIIPRCEGKGVTVRWYA